MCSRNDDEDEAQSCMEEKPKPMWTEVCQKCSKEKPVIQILQIKHAYCRDCFLAHINHKFRSTLGKSKKMKPSDLVMAAFSGSVKSHVMLHLLNAGFSEKSHKRFLFKAQVLYIDEGAVLGLPLSDRVANIRSIAGLAEQYGFTAHFTSLYYLYDTIGPRCSPLNRDSTLVIKENLEEELKNLFGNVGSLTAQEDLLKQLRKQLLLLCAKELGCGKIFTADTSTDLAIQILSDVSLGKGAHMHHDVSFCDYGDNTVKILRPLLELSSKEATFYSVYQRLGNVFIPSLCTKAVPDRSIQNLSKQFVMELMENFPSTVSTVFRTGEKLGSSRSFSEEEENICVFCQVKFDRNAAACSSVQATDFSRLISSLGPCGFDNQTLTSLSPISGVNYDCKVSVNSGSCCSKVDAQCKCKRGFQMPSLLEVEEFCCYSCRLILHDMKNLSGLPEYVLENVQKRRSLKTMRDSIKDFLLE